MFDKRRKTLTPEKFAEIYTDEKFRNRVAFAHAYHNSNGEKGRITCSYPVTYIVTEEQIAEAEAERIRAKKQAVKDNYVKLMLVGMGMAYEARYEDDVCNYRVRGEFQNPDGRVFLIEFGTGQGENLRIDHAIDRTRQDELQDSFAHQSEFFNFKKLESKTPEMKYTLSNLLQIVNKYFNCNFREIVIDNYNVSTEDYISVSPEAGNVRRVA